MSKFNLTPPRHWSIRSKLTAMAMGTTAVALLLTFVGIAAFEYFTLRAGLYEEQAMLSEIVGGNSTAAITFNRPDDATSILASLVAGSEIRAACIYDADGNILAKYAASDERSPTYPPRPKPDGHFSGANSMESFRTIKLDDKAIGTVYMRSDFRDIHERLLLYVCISPLILLAASCVGLLFIRRLQQSVSTPVVVLAETSRRISEENNYTLRARKFGNDELGQLADAFNHMLDGIRQRDDLIQNHLEEVQSARDLLETRVEQRTSDLKLANVELHDQMRQRQEAESRREQMQVNLMEASRKAGMADVATGVLHNVGNVLNSINVSIQLLQEAVRASRMTTLVKAVGLFKQHQNDLQEFLTGDARGKALPEFLIKLADALQTEHESVTTELDGLSGNIGHIREIVAMQQSLARVSGVQTEFLIKEVLNDALKINHAGLERHGVSLALEVDPSLTLNTDRHKVLQILINLISNAKYAVDNCQATLRKITLRTKIEGDHVRISVIDTGIGIPPENLTRIFSYGFTTKAHGHGFGLHSAALAAKELAGVLEVTSEGLGLGASFHLTLPLNKELAHV